MTDLEEIKKKDRPVLKKYGIKKAGVFRSTGRGETETNEVDSLVKIEQKDQPLRLYWYSTRIRWQA